MRNCFQATNLGWEGADGRTRETRKQAYPEYGPTPCMHVVHKTQESKTVFCQSNAQN